VNYFNELSEDKQVTLVEEELACCEKAIAEWNEKKKSLQEWLDDWRNASERNQ